jgi:hypothetical protein
MSQHCRRNHFIASDWDGMTPAGNSDALRMSEIYLTGPLGKIFLRVYFDLNQARRMAAETFGKAESDVSDTLAMDFMREYSNLHAGSMRAVLERNSFGFDMSLPASPSTASSELKKLSRDASGQTNVWMLTDGQTEIVCFAKIELNDDKPFRRALPELAAELHYAPGSSPKIQGDIDFF